MEDLKTKKKLARLTIDMSEEKHKQFKILAVMQGKTMRKVLIEAIEKYLKKEAFKVSK